ncbi:IS4 family transposase [Myroides odoratimimus]|uniref:IS4 family transposase n=2 Tax=Myroides TaxID=76831 RepID=UPI0025782B03|nr:IS4 family transposase [Myroides odoratimimus]MDM1497171.1 IS4 family transposase [Myroides odoratimimus]MDM1530971.1 IS4 family transposase [Myroides odoratimimus]
MSKSTYFSSKSVFGQLISLIDDELIKSAVVKANSDYYVKKFKSKDHLISMLFCCFAKCNSLREVSGAMLGLSGKTKGFQLDHIPKRSTLSDANKNREVKFFEDVYNQLLSKYTNKLSDSRIKDVVKKQVKLVDSSTISLFKDILSCVGRKSKDGKSKGGIKVHSVINADEKVPNMVWCSSAATHDHNFLKKLKCDDNTIYVFDKGYNDYKAFKHFSEHQTGFVTRIKDNASYDIIETNQIPEHLHSGVLQDQIIEVNIKENNILAKLKLRKVKFYDRENKRVFEFITNLFELRADMIAALYKLRWQIELVFKQLKQNFPLKYFLGDNENAIKIQIYCVLIVNLLISVIKKKLTRSWAFSNLVSFCKIHLFNYIKLLHFLENPEQDWIIENQEIKQLSLF